MSEFEQPSSITERMRQASRRYREYIWLANDGAYLETTSITVARKKLYARFLADLQLLLDKKATAVVESVISGVVEPAEGVAQTAMIDLKKLFEMITNRAEETAEQLKEIAKQYVTYGHPSYTGFYDRDVKPISFSQYLQLMQDDTYRRVAWTEIKTASGETVEVSTVWFGMDQSAIKGAPPLLYETAILGGKGDGRMDRYTTLNEAQAGHTKMVEWVRQMEGMP